MIFFHLSRSLRPGIHLGSTRSLLGLPIRCSSERLSRKGTPRCSFYNLLPARPSFSHVESSGPSLSIIPSFSPTSSERRCTRLEPTLESSRETCTWPRTESFASRSSRRRTKPGVSLTSSRPRLLLMFPIVSLSEHRFLTRRAES